MKLNEKLGDKIAKKILEPYLTKVLKACYDLRELSYALDFNTWCKRVNDKLKESEVKK